MVTIEDLEAFDLQVWLGSSTLAAKALHCHPSSISRRCRTVTETFQLLTLKRNQYESKNLEWRDLLVMQRRMHQQHRLLSRRKLRLEAAAQTLDRLPPGWWIPDGRQRCKAYLKVEQASLISGSVVDAIINGDHLLVREGMDRWAPVQDLSIRLGKKLVIANNLATPGLA